MRRSTAVLLFCLPVALFDSPGPSTAQMAPDQDLAHSISLPIVANDLGKGEPILQRGGKVVIGTPQEPETLYIYGGKMLAADHVFGAIYDGPIDARVFDHQAVILESLPRLEDPDSGASLSLVSVEPGERFVDPDSSEVRVAARRIDDLPQLTVRFRLVEGLTWQDGTPVRAADSVFSHRVACDEDTPMDKELCERTSDYSALDARTVGWRGLPGLVDPLYYTRFYAPLPRHQPGEDGRRMDEMSAVDISEDNVFARAPYAYGPFQIAEWADGEAIQLVRNPHYWRAGEGLPRLDGLELRFVRDANALLAAVSLGQIDVATQDGVGLAQHDSLEQHRSNGRLIPHYISSPVWEHLDFNLNPVDQRPPIGACRDVRRAVAYAVDRATMVDILQHGRTEIRDSYTPSEHWAHPAPGTGEIYRHAPEKAAQLLEELGFEDLDGDGFREAVRDITCPIVSDAGGTRRDQIIPEGTPLELVINTTQGNVLREEITLLVQWNLAAVGIDVGLEYLPPNVLFSDGPDGPLFGRLFDAAVFAWYTGVVPPADLYRCADIPSEENAWLGWNLTGWCDPAYDRLIDEASTELSRADARAKHQEAQRIFMDALPVLPLFARVKVMATRPGLVGFQPDTTVASELWNVEEWGWRVNP